MRNTWLIKNSFFLILGLLFLQAMNVHAQKLERFSGDSTKFIGELNLLFQNTVGEEHKMSDVLLQELMLKWNAEKFSAAKKQFIYYVGNLMLKKRFRVYPDFYNVLKAINIASDKYLSDDLFFEWTGVLKKLITSKNSRSFLAFIETS